MPGPAALAGKPVGTRRCDEAKHRVVGARRREGTGSQGR